MGVGVGGSGRCRLCWIHIKQHEISLLPKCRMFKDFPEIYVRVYFCSSRSTLLRRLRRSYWWKCQILATQQLEGLFRCRVSLSHLCLFVSISLFLLRFPSLSLSLFLTCDSHHNTLTLSPRFSFKFSLIPAAVVLILFISARLLEIERRRAVMYLPAASRAWTKKKNRNTFDLTCVFFRCQRRSECSDSDCSEMFILRVI